MLAIVTRGLAKSFQGVRAVDGVDLQVESGSIYGFLGPNGAGKSTTIKMLTGLTAPSEGSVHVLGFDMQRSDQALKAKRRIGVVPEGLALFENLTAVEYLTFVGRMHSMPRETISARSDDLLGMLQLAHETRKLTIEYSHGMQKKLALAAALLPNPDLLFLDEPFEGVDAVASRTIKDLLLNFARRGSTIFVTSHVLDIVDRLCTHVGIIAEGRLVEQTSLSELRQGSSLEQRFLEKVGASGAAAQPLGWLQEATT